jgi:Na+/pantothenate symporter
VTITDAILIAIALLLLGILYRLDGLHQHVETLRNIASKRFFGGD